MHYRAVEETSPYKLQNEVEKLLEQGWKLQGGIAIMKSGMYDYYCQAMVKE